VFDHPSEEFNPAQITMDLFLYDTRENLEQRRNDPVTAASDGHGFACSHLAARRAHQTLGRTWAKTEWKLSVKDPS
jgi:hypothetical protein